jgi:hypothetical protein
MRSSSAQRKPFDPCPSGGRPGSAAGGLIDVHQVPERGFEYFVYVFADAHKYLNRRSMFGLEQ